MVISLQYFISFFHSYLNTLKIERLFIAASCALAGMAYGGQSNRLLFLLAFVPFFLCYGFGRNFITELDFATPRKDILNFNKLAIALCALLICILNPLNLIFTFIALSTFFLFIRYRRKSPLLAPLYLGILITLLPMMGVLAMGGQLADIKKNQMLWLYSFTLFSFANLTLMSKVDSLKIKKILWGDLFVMISIIAAGMIINYSDSMALFVFILGSFIGIIGQIKAHLLIVHSETTTRFIKGPALRSFILWHMAVFISEKPEWFIFACFFYLFFEATLFFKAYLNEN